jgi:hypothetical protein
MKTRIISVAVAISATALGLFAQDNKTTVEIAQGAVLGGMIGSPESGPVRFVNGAFSLPGKTVTGAPYSADEKTESVQTLADGTHITNSTTTRTYRDSEGRTRREITLQALGGDQPGPTTISINDPVAGVSYTLDPSRKVAHQITMPKVQPAVLAAIPRIGIEPQANVTRTQSYSLTSNGQNVEYRVMQRSGAPAERQVQREDLGDNLIEGVNAHGTRETSTIPAGAAGNDRPLTTTSERWYSPELQLEVKSVYNDPRMGQTTHTLTAISRAEPDASLFKPPADYTLDANTPKMEFHTMSLESHP